MMEMETFIQSGMLERFVMGDTNHKEDVKITQMIEAYPQIQKELALLEETLNGYAQSHQIAPPSSLRSNILIQFEEKNYPTLSELNNLPILEESADYEFWHSITQSIPAPTQAPTGHVFPLKAEKDKITFIAWTSDRILEEHHDDLIEKFLILEGSCDCIIDGVVNHMIPGDYMEIPLHSPHHIQVTSGHMIKAILQRIMLAA